jgi:hypothetical protein
MLMTYGKNNYLHGNKDLRNIHFRKKMFNNQCGLIFKEKNMFVLCHRVMGLGNVECQTKICIPAFL